MRGFSGRLLHDRGALLVACPEHEPVPTVRPERRVDLLEVLEHLRLRDAAGDAEIADQACRHLWLPERENVCFGAGFVERDLERPLVDRFVLACELVEAAVAEHAVAGLVDVDAM